VILAGTAMFASSAEYRNTGPGVRFVGSNTCVACHREIYDEFRKTSMGRSLARVTPDLKMALPAAADIPSKTPGHSYHVRWQGADLYQSESIIDGNGHKASGPNYPVEYVVGSGTNGYTFLLRRDRWLFEAPVSYYSRSRTWDLSPGFDAYDAGFARPIRTSCLECHVGRFAPTAQETVSFPQEPFKEAAIGCENCHGPGELHVRERGAAKPSGPVDTSIVNPAKLSPTLSDNICMRCHQGNDARILQPGKTSSDFRPGAWLNDTLAIFKTPLRQGGRAEESDLLEHTFAVMLSKCYRASESMSCITCHSVHRNVPAAEKSAYYRSKCLTCHSTASCKLELSRRQPDDCVSCHMSKRAVRTISHAALTNHRIVRTPDEAYPEVAYIDNSDDSPGLIHVSRSPEPEHNRVAPLTLLQAYRSLLVKEPSLRSKYLALLNQLRLSQPSNPIVLAAAGHEELQQGSATSAERAAALLSQAIKGGESNADIFLDLANAFERNRHFDEANRVLSDALAREPYTPALHKALISLAMKTGDYGVAEHSMRTYLRLYPNDQVVGDLLKEVEAVGAK
jgi:Cytochrome c554 and c-prime